jgi:hypothetical protein
VPKTAEADEHVALRNLLHKLNNDLSLVIGYIDLALRSAKDSPSHMTGRLNSAKDAAKRMAISIADAQKGARDGRHA